jgi:hypothetical protein
MTEPDKELIGGLLEFAAKAWAAERGCTVAEALGDIVDLRNRGELEVRDIGGRYMLCRKGFETPSLKPM